MLRPERSIERVYLHRAPIDMRKQMDGLAALVEGALRLDPFSSALFVFINRRRDKLKILVACVNRGLEMKSSALSCVKMKSPSRRKSGIRVFLQPRYAAREPRLTDLW